MNEGEEITARVRHRRFAQILVVASYVLLFGSGFAELVLTDNFLAAPTSQQPNAGRAATYNDHGKLHYITEQDDWLQKITITIPFIAVAGIAVGMFLKNRIEQ